MNVPSRNASLERRQGGAYGGRLRCHSEGISGRDPFSEWNPVFQRHGFFAGRWPVKEMGLTAMDYGKVACPEAEAVLRTCVRVTIHEAMSERYVRSVAEAIRKVVGHYAA